MPIPKTKSELLTAMEREYRLLMESIGSVDEANRTVPGVCHQWSVKDVIAHLVGWKKMLLTWWAEGLEGGNPRTPAADLKWNQTPELNRRIYEQWRDVPWDEVLREFESTWQALHLLAVATSEADLFRKGLYPWMRVWPLARWISANTSSHYLWARTRIRRFSKTLR
ncbi:MAG: ClbS/DfsB family four-helix bundle protein [Acidobacteria bacterium]|nr:ClbS/DfsB family four-helix bundle protein [Acidobacteriota bacterium]